MGDGQNGREGERKCARSARLFARARALIPGGVNSPVRAFSAVDSEPPFIARGEGAYLYDADGNAWLDYVCSWGATILGHAHPDLVAATDEAARGGLSFGAPTENEVRLAERITGLMPSMEMVRLVNSGTEAAMSALRLARGFTRRDRIVKFEGNYHGHADQLLVGAGSGAQTFGVPDSAGVPEGAAADTLVARYNDAEQVREIFARSGGEIAAVIVEPIAGNMNYVRAEDAFLAELREQCSRHGGVLIFDEVMTGFRVALGGAQSLYGVAPDLTVLGKVVGGGLPLAAFGGRRDIMERLAPVGPVYQAGTLSGNPVAVACGLAALERVAEKGFYARLGGKVRRLCEGLRTVAHAEGVPLHCDGEGGMFGFVFPAQPLLKRAGDAPAPDAEAPITRYAQVKGANQDRFRAFHQGMMAHGVYLAPSAYEAGFVSAAHSDADINRTLGAAHAVLRDIAAQK